MALRVFTDKVMSTVAKQYRNRVAYELKSFGTSFILLGYLMFYD